MRYNMWLAVLIGMLTADANGVVIPMIAWVVFWVWFVIITIVSLAKEMSK